MKIVYKWLHAFVASHILQKVFIVLCGFGALFTMEFTFSMEIMKNSEGFMNIGLELLTWNTCFSNLNKTLKTHINPGVMSGTKMFHMQLCILTVHPGKTKEQISVPQKSINNFINRKESGESRSKQSAILFNFNIT